MQTESIGDRVRLPVNFDIDRMKQDIDRLGLDNYTYYRAKPLRAPAHEVDPSRPFLPPADDYADGTWTEWLDTQELVESDYLKEIVEYFQQHTRVTLVRILLLEAGQVVKEHTDPTLGLQIEKSVVRLTIPVTIDAGVKFYLNNEVVNMKPGECWYMRLTDPHKVVNESPVSRVSISIDMEPNQWLRDMIVQGTA